MGIFHYVHTGGRFVYTFATQGEQEWDMRLLIPDASREQLNELFFCLPIDTERWMNDRKVHLHFAPNKVGYHMRKRDSKNESIVIIFQDSTVSDDDAVTAAAWLRLVHECRDPIYIVPHERSPDDNLHSLIQRSMGSYQGKVKSLDGLSYVIPPWIKDVTSGPPT